MKKMVRAEKRKRSFRYWGAGKTASSAGEFLGTTFNFCNDLVPQILGEPNSAAPG